MEHVQEQHGVIRAWGTGYFVTAELGPLMMEDRYFAVTDTCLAWGIDPYMAYVEVDFRDNYQIDIEQVADGSWSIALLPVSRSSHDTRSPRLFNFAKVFGGDLKTSREVAQFLGTRFPRHDGA